MKLHKSKIVNNSPWNDIYAVFDLKMPSREFNIPFLLNVKHTIINRTKNLYHNDKLGIFE